MPLRESRDLTGGINVKNQFTKGRLDRPHSNVEVISIILADMADQIDSMIESAFGSNPLLCTSRRISSKCQNIATSRIVCFLWESEVKLAHLYP